MFLGKGGVGKTTCSAAYACALAARDPTRTIALLSTDPAHSLSDIFEVRLGDEFRRVVVHGNSRRQMSAHLDVAQIDAEKRLDSFLSEHRPELLELIEQGTFFDRDDIEPLLQTTLPGMAEMAALLRISDLIEAGSDERYDEIVLDTAPMGHTLRLLELPQTFLRFLDFLELAASRDQVLAATFGGTGRLRGAFVREWREKSEQLMRTLSGPETEIWMVSSPEQFSTSEIARAVEELRTLEPPLHVSGLVLNRVPIGTRGNKACPRCERVEQQAKQAERELRKIAPDAPVRTGEDDGAPLLGADRLQEFGEQVFFRRAARRKMPGDTKIARFPKLTEAPWPELDQAVGFSIGKGGVGKTTVAASVAYVSASRGDAAQRVTICSIDPAPSLDDIFARPIGEERVSVAGQRNLYACELDAPQEYRRWAAPLQARIERAFSRDDAKRGVHVELSFEREMFLTLLDIVPPGVDELFAILRIAELTGQDASERLVIDMAPTGHALELLRTPERMLGWARLLMRSLAPHRALPLAQEIAVEVATVAQRVRGLLKSLETSRVWMVMLPEPLPDRESTRLLESLEALKLPATAVLLNRVLLRASDCARCDRARAWQVKTITDWKKRARSGRMNIYVVPEFDGEIAGAARLREFTSKLYELA